MTVFVYEKLRAITIWLLEKVVSANILQENSSISKLMKLDLQSKANLLLESSVDTGFEANAALNNLNRMQATNTKISGRCEGSGIRMVEILMEGSLKYSLTFVLAAFSPLQIVVLSEVAFIRRFSKLL